MNLIFVDPEKTSSMTQTMIDYSSDPLNLPIVVFPEFHTTTGGALLAFDKIAFVSEYSVQPVAFRYNLWLTPDGYSTVCNVGNSLLEFFWNLVSIPWVTVSIEVLPCLKCTGSSANPNDNAIQAQLAIANCLGVPAVDRIGPWIRKRASTG
jgi:hypothetical protein